MTVTVYTKPECVQCEWTMKHLSGGGVPFTQVPMTPDDLEKFKEQGYGTAPIVVTEHDTWDGFRIDKIRGLIKSRKA